MTEPPDMLPAGIGAVTTVVHCKRDPYDIYIGRPSKWGSPFVIGRDGARENVIAKYRAWIIHQPTLMSAIGELRGKALGCWCAPAACHGNVLAGLAAQTEFTISGRDQYGNAVSEKVTTLPKTRIIVCGGRDYADRARLYGILDAAVTRLNLGFLIQGGATGADALAKEWAAERNVLCAEYPADWSQGPSAGPRRNALMLSEGAPDIVIAFPGGHGTRNMCDQARAAGVRVIGVDG